MTDGPYGMAFIISQASRAPPPVSWTPSVITVTVPLGDVVVPVTSTILTVSGAQLPFQTVAIPACYHSATRLGDWIRVKPDEPVAACLGVRQDTH